MYACVCACACACVYMRMYVHMYVCVMLEHTETIRPTQEVDLDPDKYVSHLCVELW